MKKQTGYCVVKSLLAGALLLGATAVPSWAASGVPALGPVFVIIGENAPLSQLSKNTAPYLLGTLAPASAWLTNYWGTTHYSEANYVAMTSGQYTECQQLDGPPASCHQDVPNLFQQLRDAGKGFSTWSESMPGDCWLLGSGEAASLNIYAPKHNPQLFFDNVNGVVATDNGNTQGSAACRNSNFSASTSPYNANDMDAFLQALSSNSDKIRDFNLVVPNNCENGHDNCRPAGNPINQFDNFLSRVVPAIQAYITARGQGLLIVTFDEGLDSSPWRAVKFGNGGNVAFAAWGPAVRNGNYNAGPYNHYSFLRTMEDGFGLGYVGNAATAAPIDMIWKP
jgi:hypothetical protein